MVYGGKTGKGNMGKGKGKTKKAPLSRSVRAGLQVNTPLHQNLTKFKHFKFKIVPSRKNSQVFETARPPKK